MGSSGSGGSGEDLHYPVLVETVANLCRQESSAAAVAGAGAEAGSVPPAPLAVSGGGHGPRGAVVGVAFDEHVLSPKNGFITVIKGAAGA